MFYLPQGGVSVRCFTQSKAWSGEESGVISLHHMHFHLSFMLVLKSDSFTIDHYVYFLPLCALSRAQVLCEHLRLSPGGQTCSSVAVSNGDQTADGPLATFLGRHVEHALHLQQQ